jgi:spore coat protein CotH
MNKFFYAILLLLVILLNACDNSSKLVISEIVAKSHIPDYLNGNDWIELQNLNPRSINLKHFSIKNSKSQLVNLPNIILQPGQFSVIQASCLNTPQEGYYLPFELSQQDSVILYSGSTQIDSLTWKGGEAKKGCSYGRLNGSVQTLYPTPHSANVPYILFFDNEVFTVKIITDDRSWHDLLRHPIQEYWYPADLEFNGAVIKDIYFRTKGSSSERAIAELGENHRSYGRYSFKLKFNAKKDQKFMGMKRLVFNNGYGDPTLMRDLLAYRIMKEVGMPASEVSFIDLWINDKHLGIYQMIEPVDGEYVEKYFPDDKKNGFKGDLYKAFCTLQWKPGQTLRSYTTGRFPQLELKTNEETIGTDMEGKALMAFLKSINTGSSELIDTDNMTRYTAAMTLISNYDSYFANEGNYYLYEHRSIDAFTMLPWDFNLSLGRSIKEGKKCEDPVVLIDHPTIKPVEERPMIARLLENEELRNEYHDHLKTLLKYFFNPEDIRAFLKEKREFIDPYVKNDPTGFYSYESWKKSFTENVSDGTDHFGKAGALLPFIDARYDNVKRQLEGKIPSSNKSGGPCP